MSSDKVILQCMFCPHKQTVRLRAGDWWTCKKCGRRNPGPTAVASVIRPLIEAGQFVIGRRRRRNVVPTAGAPAGAAATAQKAAAPTAGTTVGTRKVRRTREPITATSTKVAPPKPRSTPHPQPPAKPPESSSSVGRRLLGVLKEAVY